MHKRIVDDGRTDFKNAKTMSELNTILKDLAQLKLVIDEKILGTRDIGSEHREQYRPTPLDVCRLLHTISTQQCDGRAQAPPHEHDRVCVEVRSEVGLG